MEDKLKFIESLFERAEEYGKTGFELIKLRALDKTAVLVSTFISRGIIVLILSIFLVFVNIGMALWLSDLFGKAYLGFFCIAGFYAIVGLVIYFFMKDRIKKHISDSIISQMLN